MGNRAGRIEPVVIFVCAYFTVVPAQGDARGGQYLMGVPAEGFAAWLNSIQDPIGPAAGVRVNIAGKSSYIPGMIAAGWLAKKRGKSRLRG